MITQSDITYIEASLGRFPEGAKEVIARDKKGNPIAVRVASVVHGKPFPTLYWLVHKDLKKRIDQIEAQGHVKEFEEYVSKSEALQKRLFQEHLFYVKKRSSYMGESEIKWFQESPLTLEIFESKGIGGIADWKRTRCFHMFYAAHLASPNAVGEFLDSQFELNDLI